MQAQIEHLDVLIIGAGLSGISAAFHLQRDCPGKRYAILEGRGAIGGTWDLFRYPGVRSDSDMYTLGYSFRPWQEQMAIADGPAILKYVRDTARLHGIEPHIRYQHKVLAAAWSSSDASWTLQVQKADLSEVTIRCNFLIMCAGYYRYSAGYTPEFAGLEGFKGEVVHPQKWHDQIDYQNKRVVVIGSGATAVTLVPELAAKAAHVTMLQRSPTYMVSQPSVDNLALLFRRLMPLSWAYGLTRWKNVLLAMFVFNLARKRPEKVKQHLLKLLKLELSSNPKQPDAAAEKLIEHHFTPRYNPWEQRLCLVPDSDFFKAIKQGKASVVTDHIDHFESDGIVLKSGAKLLADLVVTATGLQLQMLGGMQVSVDGVAIDPAKCVTYKGMMYSGVPNMAVLFGYTNASWTLKADLTSAYICRLLNHMQSTGAKRCMPVLNDAEVKPEPFVDFSSGYFQRALHLMPKQGSKHPWRLHQNYAKDIVGLRYGKLVDEAIEFT